MISKLKKITKICFVTLCIVFIIFSVLPFLLPIDYPSKNYRPYYNSEFILYKDNPIHIRKFEPKDSIVKGHLMFIHGFAGSTFSFESNMSYFQEKGYEVIAIDIPPFGHSSKDFENFSTEERAALIRFIQTKTFGNIAQWHLIGHSMGAGIVTQFAQDYSENTKTITLIDGGFSTSKEESWINWNKLFLYPSILRWAEFVAHTFFYNEEKITELLNGAYSQTPTSKQVDGYLYNLKPKGIAAGIFKMSASESSKPIIVEQLKTPILMIWGSEDNWVPKKYGQQLVEKVPSIEWFEVENAGHCPMETHPNIVNDKIYRFITD